MLKKILILQIAGKKEQILEEFFHETDSVEFIKCSEKIVANPKLLMKIMCQRKFDAIYFATDNIEFQKFKFPMKVYLFFSHTKNKGIIDDMGFSDYFSKTKLFFQEFPMFIVSIFESIYYVSKIYIKLFCINRKFSGKVQ